MISNLGKKYRINLSEDTVGVSTKKTSDFGRMN